MSERIPSTSRPLARRVLRLMLWGGITLLLLVGSGLLLGDRLTPPATGAPSTALPPTPDRTPLDRELAPLLARHPGMTGALLMPHGEDAFAARALSARKAGRSLDLMYYIWHDDLAGRLLAREVWMAANRGVRVRLLLDDINLSGLDDKLQTLDSHANIEVRLYNPFRNRDGLGRIREMVQRVFSLNHRMHNKAWIADNRVAVVGGRNIGSEYFEAGEDVNFRDLDLALFGPAVQDTSAIFDRYWNSPAVVPLEKLSKADPEAIRETLAWFDREVRSEDAQHYLRRVAETPNVRDYAHQQLEPFWTDRLVLVADPPVKRDATPTDDWLVHRIERDLRATRRKALLISPYFVPGDDATRHLGALARNGATVGVVTNSLAANDVSAVYGGYRAYRTGLLQAGVAVHELRARSATGHSLFGSRGASLHTKAYTIDDRRGFIGSFNLDPRSAWLNTEMGVMFDDPALAIAVRDEYLRLSAPASSWWMYLSGDGDTRWLDVASTPPHAYRHEPDTTAWQRFTARLVALLPMESQL